MSEVYFVGGIDTDVGKTYATGYLAELFAKDGKSVITQKLCQTGNDDDSATHRKISSFAGVGFSPEHFSFPASPHLSARLEGRRIDLDRVVNGVKQLQKKCDVVLVEGVGGLMVPLNDELLQIDFVKKCGYKVVLVTSAKLGSINHTLLSIEALKNRDMELSILLYNHFAKSCDEIIKKDTQEFLFNFIQKSSPQTRFLQMGELVLQG